MLNENVNNQTKEVFDTIPIPRNIKKLKGRVDKLKEEKKLSLEREAKKEGISYENLIKNKEDAAAYTVASMTPLLGDAIAIKELPNDIQEIKNLFEQGFREGDFKKLGLGTLYTAAVTAGILPFAGVVGRAGKKVIKSSLDKAKPLYDKQIEMMQGFPPSGPDALATANNVPVKSMDETDKLLDKTKVDVPINTEIPTLKAQDLANKPTINPSMIGVETELGRKQVALYEKLIKDSKVLDGKPPSPQRLFERTGVYKGSDGKYRFDLDDRDATFNTSFLEKALVKNPNMKDPPTMLSNSIVSYKYLEPKLFSLREVLDFDSLYKQYGKTLKVGDKAYSNIGNTKVKFISGKSGTRGSYDGDTDTITLNISDSDGQKLTDLGKIESTLLHEVQHAIQRREGFLRGGNSDTMLDKINPRHSQEVKATTKELNDKKDLMKDNVRIGFENVDAFKHNDVRYDREQAVNYAVDQMAIISYSKLLGKEYVEATKKLQEDLGEFLKNSKFPRGIQEKIQKSGDDFFFDVQAKKVDLDAQKEKSFADYEDLYGEREARLVQKRYEKRKAYKAMSGGLDFGDDKITTALRKDTSFIDNMSNNKAQGGLQLNKGGTTMNMNKQMDMFDEGGLKEEGGTVDPISGNDVPIGSTKEEVRDDIPAQLSEGEFVFPADVTRFIGLEKLMQMRQEAKAGLKRMEDMGQMGNSEEATMPDDMPFDINDLDTEEEEEYNNDSQEMNQGGVIQAATGTFVNQGTGVTSVPSQFAGMNLPSSGTNPAPTYTIPTIPTNVSGYTPKFTAQTGQTNQKVAPTFQTLIGNNPGQYDEMRTYVNDAGQTMDIPFKNGEPIYPIPEGYKFQDPEAIIAEEPTTTTVIPKTTRVVQQDENDDPNKPRTGRITISDPSNDKTGQKTYEINKANIGSIKGGGYSITDPKTGATTFITEEEAKALNMGGIQSGVVTAKTNFQDGQPPELTNILDRLSFQNDIKAVETSKAGVELSKILNLDARKNVLEKIFSANLLKTVVDVVSGKANRSAQYDKAVREIMTGIAQVPEDQREDVTKEVNKLMKETFEITDDGDFKQLKGKTKEQVSRTPVFNVREGTVDIGGKTIPREQYDKEQNIAAVKANEARAKENFAYAGEPIQSSYKESDYSRSDSFGGTQSTESQQEDAGGSFVGDDPFNKGGIVSKKKPKVKKMKRGGLASR